MSWDDDDDDGRSSFRWITWSIGSSSPQPMTAAGRFLRALETGDSSFKSNDEAISDELACALRRIEIRSRWPEFQQ